MRNKCLQMGCPAQFNFLLAESKTFSRPPENIIYSGAAAGGAAAGENDFSKIFPSALFHKTDIEDSERIDIQWDLELEPENHLIGKYDLFISTSVLEHVRRPWIAAKNMEKTVLKGGYLYISVPWVWDFHEFPKDYWRFSHQSLDILFEDSVPISTAMSTYPDCILYELNPYIDREITMKTSDILDNGIKTECRGVPLLMIHQIRQII